MGKNILLVEDEPTLQRILGSILTDAGHRVATTGTAEAALEQVRSRDDIDLVLSDKNLPAMNGLELLEQVRAHEKAVERHVGFVLVTGYPSRESALSVLAAGGDGYLVKPFRSLSHAMQEISTVLDSDLAARRRRNVTARRAAAAVAGIAGQSLTGVAAFVSGPETGVTERLRAALARAGARIVSAAADARDGVVCATGVADLRVARTIGAAQLLCDPSPPFDDLLELIGGGGGAVADPALTEGAPVGGS